jgi:hypothetical protein
LSVVGLVVTCILTIEGARAGWNPDAWPSCEHSGKLFIDGTNLYRQVWAVDVWHALKERSGTLYPNGWAEFTGGTTSSWWRTEAGVRAKVIREEGAVLEFFKDKTAVLAASFVRPGITNINEAMEAPWEVLEDTITVTARTGCSGGRAATNNVEVNYAFGFKWPYPYQPFDELLNLDLTHTYTEGLGTNLTEVAGVPRYFFWVQPNRLRGGYCGPDGGLGAGLVYSWPSVTGAVGVVTLDGTAVDGPCSGSEIGVGIFFGRGPNLPNVTGSSNFDVSVPPFTNPYDEWMGGSYTGVVWTVSTNRYPLLDFDDVATIRVTNTCASVASNVVVSLNVDTNVTVTGVGGSPSVLAGLRWQDYRVRPVDLLLPTMTSGQVAEITLSLDWHRDMGRPTVYPDFGWDSLRKVINKLDSTLAGSIFSAYGSDFIEVEWWNDTSDNNFFAQSLDEDSSNYTNDTWSVVTAFVAAGSGYNEASVRRSHGPSSISRALRGYYESQECDEYWVGREYSWSKVSVTNLTAFVHRPASFDYSVHVMERDQLRYSTSAVDCETVETGTNTGNFITAAKVGDTGFPDWPGDPNDFPGLEETLNYVSWTRFDRDYMELFVVLTWDFEYDED